MKQLEHEDSPSGAGLLLSSDGIKHWADMVVSLIDSAHLMESPPFEESPFFGFAEAKLCFDMEGTPVILWIKRGYK